MDCYPLRAVGLGRGGDKDVLMPECHQLKLHATAVTTAEPVCVMEK